MITVANDIGRFGLAFVRTMTNLMIYLTEKAAYLYRVYRRR